MDVIFSNAVTNSPEAFPISLTNDFFGKWPGIYSKRVASVPFDNKTCDSFVFKVRTAVGNENDNFSGNESNADNTVCSKRTRIESKPLL